MEETVKKIKYENNNFVLFEIIFDMSEIENHVKLLFDINIVHYLL